MRHLFIGIAVLATLNTTAAFAWGRPRITINEARDLVMAALTDQQRRMPGAAAEYDGDKTGSATTRYIGVTAIWDGQPNGSVVQGVYDVDTYTGDVFSAAAACKTYSNPRLRRLQARIRSRLHLTAAGYGRIRTRGNLCSN